MGLLDSYKRILLPERVRPIAPAPTPSTSAPVRRLPDPVPVVVADRVAQDQNPQPPAADATMSIRTTARPAMLWNQAWLPSGPVETKERPEGL